MSTADLSTVLIHLLSFDKSLILFLIIQDDDDEGISGTIKQIVVFLPTHSSIFKNPTY